MSDANAILTREELDAVLAAVAGGGDDARVHRDAGATDSPRFAWGPLARALREFGESTGRSLSTLFQRPLSFPLIDLRLLPADDFAAAMLSTDAPALVRFQPQGSTGAVMVGRTLLYGWLTLRFGGSLEATPLHVPTRRLSHIERKQVLRAVSELTERLAPSLSSLVATQLEIGALVEPELLAPKVAPRLWVASFDARGFGEVGRLRVALPDALLASAREERPARARGALGEHLAEAPLRLTAEVGGAQIPLRRLGELRVGDVFPLTPAAADGVLVRVEGQPKFRGMRGQLGAQLAVRITERV
jgi:flagellar motor switch protein FliM